MRVTTYLSWTLFFVIIWTQLFVYWKTKVIEENKQGTSLVLQEKKENSKKLFIESYGCAMNFSDSEIKNCVISHWGKFSRNSFSGLLPKTAPQNNSYY